MIHNHNSSLKNTCFIISIVVLSITDIIEQFFNYSVKNKVLWKDKPLKILTYFQSNYINKSKKMYIYT